MDTAMMGLSHKPKMPKGMKDMRKHGIARTMIEHHHDGSHQITHEHMKLGTMPTKHGAKDLEELHDHMEQHLGGMPTDEEMNEGEETATPPMMSK
jgi:hypothetical protein